MLREASGTVKVMACGTCILRVIHGRDARATFVLVVFPAIVSAEEFFLPANHYAIEQQ
jgi:hypothetical protein